MRSHASNPKQKANGEHPGFEGIAEDVKGKVREIIGRLTRPPDGNAELRRGDTPEHGVRKSSA
jgi:uncharacterized protein YjbJ (UPF0337 family)